MGLVMRLKEVSKTTWKVLHMAVTDYFRDDAPLLGAGVAFWAVLSLSPMLVILVVVASLAYDGATARETMVTWLHQNVGGQAAESIIGALENASAPGAITVPGLISLGLMFWGATRFFSALQGALNKVWNVRPRRHQKVRHAVFHVARNRVMTFLLLMSLALLLMISLGVGTALPVIYGTMTGVPGAFYFYRVLDLVISTTIVSVGVGLVYMILPDVRVPWRYVWKGALVTGGLLIFCRVMLGWYLGRADMGSYGAAGSLAALLLWIYFSTQFFFFGAELTQAYVRFRGVREEPKPQAEWADRRRRSPEDTPATEPEGPTTD
jgi:membrane protein